MHQKQCKTCGETKDISEFGKHERCVFGVRNVCKKCTTAAQLEYQKKNRPQYIEYQKNHYKENKAEYKEYRKRNAHKRREWQRNRYKNDAEYREKVKQSVKDYREQNPLQKKNTDLLRMYGISLDDFNALLKKQKNSCAICGKSSNKKTIFPHIDHCHKTGVVRGLLCTKCNMGLGQFNDNKAILLAAINYLEGK